MIGVIYILVLGAGFLVGLLPGISGLIVFILTYRKKKKGKLLVVYVVTAAVLIIILSLMNPFLRNLPEGAMTKAGFFHQPPRFFLLGNLPRIFSASGKYCILLFQEDGIAPFIPIRRRVRCGTVRLLRSTAMRMF